MPCARPAAPRRATRRIPGGVSTTLRTSPRGGRPEKAAPRTMARIGTRTTRTGSPIWLMASINSAPGSTVSSSPARIPDASLDRTASTSRTPSAW